MRNAAMRLATGALFILAGLIGTQAAQANAKSNPLKTLSSNAETLKPRTLKGHTNRVMSVAFSPDGRTIASASDDDTIKLWDVVNGRELRTLPGHKYGAESVVFSPDGRTIASGGGDNMIKLWDAASGKELQTLSGHKGMVRSVAFSPDGRTIASGGGDNMIKLWDAASGRELRTLSGHNELVRSVAFSPDGRTIASASDDETIKLWDAASGRELQTIKGHKDHVFSVAFSPDGQTIASGSADNTIKLWSAVAGWELRTLQGQTAHVVSVAFSPDGRTLASGNSDGTIKLCDAASGRELRMLAGHSDVVPSIAFSPDGRTMASGSWDNTAKLWSLGVDADASIETSVPPHAPLTPATTVPTPIATASPVVNSGPTSVAVAAPSHVIVPPVAPPTHVAPSDRRVALVIGNSAYPSAALANPAIDADLVSASLGKAGFDVTEVKNADFAQFDAALTHFVGKEQGADIALFYFAGHGFAIPGDDLHPRNYLMATSADISATSDAVLRRDGFSIDEIMRRISPSAKVTLAFIDACRNDPFHRGAGDRGFEPITVASSQQIYIGMSTQLGKTAIDGLDGMGSPFAQAFAEQMTTPGLRIDDAFRALREEVSRKTDGKQKPEILQDDLQQGALVLVK